MFFSRDMVASFIPENRRLRAFEKVELQSGETKAVTLPLKAGDLAFVDSDGKWTLEKGDFRMQTGTKGLNLACTKTHKWPPISNILKG